ncbi:hypothetical protein B0H15DRAFT_168744 [Mycena belliarum]|uniref:Glycosyl hydrolase family 38 C-terminal domain-containing protein n=1 Tax=Mycena belliarum TaxID=1033014 RepID=A0AAD6U6S9_9AGAR|nr:hypothetical protein B0H15DRAFT_168744 [Mycena belliae]
MLCVFILRQLPRHRGRRPSPVHLPILSPTLYGIVPATSFAPGGLGGGVHPRVGVYKRRGPLRAPQRELAAHDLRSWALLLEGASGALLVFEDRPNSWDAWDDEIHHPATLLSFERVSVVAQGSLRAAVHAEVAYCASRIWVTISLDALPASTKADSRSLMRFDANVDWHQRHETLKFDRAAAHHSQRDVYVRDAVRAPAAPDAQQHYVGHSEI